MYTDGLKPGKHEGIKVITVTGMEAFIRSPSNVKVYAIVGLN